MPAPKIRSKDSIQQRLRDHKRDWNSRYKDFSQKLKSFKDGLNGRGNAKTGLPPSNIKEPLPGEIGALLGQMSGEFQQLVGDAESIISEQSSYAQTRRRRAAKPTQVNPSTEPQQPPVPEQDKIVDTLSRLGSIENLMEKDASNRFSRFWQYISGIFSTKEFNKQRLGLLSQSANLYYSLLDLENDVLSPSVNSIPSTIGKYKKFKYDFTAFTVSFDGVVDMLLKAKEEQDKNPNPKPSDNKPEDKSNDNGKNKLLTPSEQAQQVSPMDKIKKDLHLLYNQNLAKNQIMEINEMIGEYDGEEDQHLKSMWFDRIKDSYKTLINSISNEVQKRYGPANVKNVEDIINLIKKNTTKEAELDDDNMIKNAHNAMTRFLKKQLVKSIPFNKTSVVRLEIVEIVDDMKKIIKEMMNNLEKEISIEELKTYISSLEEERIKMKRPLHALNIFYMKEFFSKKDHKDHKIHDPNSSVDEELLDFVLRRKLKRELSEDLT